MECSMSCCRAVRIFPSTWCILCDIRPFEMILSHLHLTAVLSKDTAAEEYKHNSGKPHVQSVEHNHFSLVLLAKH